MLIDPERNQSERNEREHKKEEEERKEIIKSCRGAGGKRGNWWRLDRTTDNQTNKRDLRREMEAKGNGERKKEKKNIETKASIK